MKIVILSFSLLLPFSGKGQLVDSLALIQLSQAVTALQNSPLLANGTLGFSLSETGNDREILGLNQHKSMASASTLKLYTTATAMAVLGKEFQFKTYLEHEGTVRNDSLYGNVFIRGTGDPTLGSSRFSGFPSYREVIKKWLDVIRATGVRHINGDIIADNGAFDQKSIADSWNWSDIGNYYGAGANGVNINENFYSVLYKPGKAVGSVAELVGTDPALPGKKITSLVTTGNPGSGDKVNIYAGPGSTEIILTGTVPRGPATFSVKGSISESPAFTAEMLRRALIENGVSVLGKATQISGNTSASRKNLHTFQSPPLSEISRQTNLWSVNVFADALLKVSALQLGGSTEFGAAVETTTKFWQTRGIHLQGFYPKDGSGLSTSGSVTASNLTSLLNGVYKTKEFKDFYETMAILGQSGTVRNLAKNTRAAGNIRVKSGSIEGTRAYAGYVTTKSGALLSFSMNAHKYVPDKTSEVVKELTRLMILIGEL